MITTDRSCLILEAPYCPRPPLPRPSSRNAQLSNRGRIPGFTGSDLTICYASIWLMLLLNLVRASSFPEDVWPGYSWLPQRLENRLSRLSSIIYHLEKCNSIPSCQDQRRKLEENSPLEKGSSAKKVFVSSSELPQRVRIAPFDLLLAPTPIQLMRADEDLLLVALQELIILFMKSKFGNEGSITNRMGADTTLEYVLFSDIEENAWSQGAKNFKDLTMTVLRLNGGVASFVGPDIPSEEDVNEWVKSAINGLFVAALAETPYQYVERAQYMTIDDPNTLMHSGENAFAVPSSSTPDPRPLQRQPLTPPGGSLSRTEEDFPLFYVLLCLLVAFGAMGVISALWIRHNNRAVRVLCLNGKEREEIVDFCDDAPISILHETGKAQKAGHQDGNELQEDEETASGIRKDVLVTLDNSTSNLQYQSSLATNVAMDEASLQSSMSECTIPTVSALSFRNPNPFSKDLVAQESFQNERKTYISKDMLFSSWSGKGPNLDRNGRRYDDSVLQPSYFSAAKEWEHLANIAATTRPENDREQKASRRSKEKGSDPQAFRFEAIRERVAAEAPDGIYMVTFSQACRSTEKAGRRTPRLDRPKMPPSNFV